MIVVRMRHLVWIVHQDDEYVDLKQYFVKRPIVCRVVKPSKRSAICFTYQFQQYGKNTSNISASKNAKFSVHFPFKAIFFFFLSILTELESLLFDTSGWKSDDCINGLSFIGFLWHEKVYYRAGNVVELPVYQLWTLVRVAVVIVVINIIIAVRQVHQSHHFTSLTISCLISNKSYCSHKETGT